MPRTLSEQEFDAAKAKVLASAPKGLDEKGFEVWWSRQGHSILDGAIAEAENSPAPLEGSAVGRFVSGAAEMLNPVTAARGLMGAVAHPIATGRNLLSAQGAQFSKASDDFAQGRYFEMAGHAAAGALPLLGPAAAGAGEQIAEGDVAGGLGKGAGLVGGVALAGPATRAVGKAVRPATTAVAEKLYQSALKPTKAVLNGVRATGGPDAARQALVKTGLAEGIPVSPAGAAKAEALIDTLNAEVSSRIKAATANGATVDPQAVQQAIADVAKDFAVQVNAQPELAAIASVGENFAKNPEVAQTVSPATPANFARGQIKGSPAQTAPKAIPVDVAQRMKQNTYKGLRGKYGRELGGTIEAEKAGARALKEGISDAVPEVAPLNARESAVIPLEEAIADAMRRRGNYGVFGLTPIVAAGASAASGHVWPLLAALTDRAPGLLSRTGIALNRVGRSRGLIGPAVGRTVVATNPTVSQTQSTGSGSPSPWPVAP